MNAWALTTAAVLVFVFPIIAIHALSYAVDEGWVVLHHSEIGAMGDLKMAIVGYQTEYNRFPLLSWQDNEKSELEYMESTSPLLEILMGTDVSRNPRRIQFYQPKLSRNNRIAGLVTENGTQKVRDMWGHVYRIHVDRNGDRTIPDPEHLGDVIHETKIIYSAGPDGDYTTWRDNVKSWGP